MTIGQQTPTWKLLDKRNELKTVKDVDKPDQSQVLAVNYALEQLRIEIQSQEEINKSRAKQIKKQQFVREIDANKATVQLHLASSAPPGITTDGKLWKFSGFDQDSFKLSSGGEVVGTIKPGLPPFSMPVIDLGVFSSLLSAALVISLVGFMEAISIAKAISAKTKQRVDPNQELIGQGLSNIVGSISNAFPVSGSFSRSAVNINAGAVTGLSSVFTAVFVLLTLLFLTPLLYHLPQSVLAAIVIMAVIGLINFQAIKHAWHAHKHDGAAAVVTFVATLAFAPHLDNGIMFGAGLAIVLFLLRTMKPRVAILGRCKDGTLRDIRVRPDLATSKHVVAMRLDGSLYFANVAYFEDTLLEAVAGHPDAKFVLVVSDGINQLDASGEEVIHHLVERLGKNGVTLVFSGLKKQVLDIMHKTGLYGVIGAHNIFATEDHALADIYSRMGVERDEMLPHTI
jgi:sulfate permease, SulP family